MNNIIKKIVDFMFPMCPRGGHRERGGLVTHHINGEKYCFHKDCIKEAFAVPDKNDADLAPNDQTKTNQV